MSSSFRKLLFLDMDGVIVDLPTGQSRKWGEEDYWMNLSKYPWSDELVALCDTLYEVHILSSLGGGAASATGKMRWIEHHYPQLADGTILTKDKKLLAAKRRILVDDDPDNIRQFCIRRGRGILFPNKERFPGAKTKTVEEVFQWLAEQSF